jgi:hypothetical protein
VKRPQTPLRFQNLEGLGYSGYRKQPIKAGAQGPSLLEKFQAMRRAEGTSRTLRNVIQYIGNVTVGTIVRRFIRIEYDGRTISYLGIRTNTERMVELPVALALFSDRPGQPGRNLEIGNVLSSWTNVQWDVLDKYEQGPGIMNQDVVDFCPISKYNFILSISTLEHVGFDESTLEPGKFERAVRNLYLNCLAAGGRMILTLPLGYNPEVDSVLQNGHLQLGTVRYLMRTSALNLWRMVVEGKENPWENYPRYGEPYQSATAIAVWTIDKCDGKTDVVGIGDTPLIRAQQHADHNSS